MASVRPKPLTGPEPRKKSSPAAISVVALESATALHAFWNPVVNAERRERFGRSAHSSLARSKTRTFASTAIPIARTNPASPGRVRVTPRATSAAYEITPYAPSATAASAPRRR
ncbi:hypothetical protein SBADM41S_08432 [Streptomyces badius]